MKYPARAGVNTGRRKGTGGEMKGPIQLDKNETALSLDGTERRCA